MTPISNLQGQFQLAILRTIMWRIYSLAVVSPKWDTSVHISKQMACSSPASFLQRCARISVERNWRQPLTTHKTMSRLNNTRIQLWSAFAVILLIASANGPYFLSRQPMHTIQNYIGPPTLYLPVFSRHATSLGQRGSTMIPSSHGIHTMRRNVERYKRNSSHASSP